MAKRKEEQKTSQVTYAGAINRLQDILQELDDDSLDFDKMINNVREASELIKFCKSKIASTEMSVKEILESLDAPDMPAAPQPEENGMLPEEAFFNETDFNLDDDEANAQDETEDLPF